jgi:hypothetical protein
MTKQEYKDYEERVARFFEEEGINNLSNDYEKDPNCEGGFSWRGCDCCGNPLGNTLYDANGWNPTEKQVQEYQVCGDCLYYAEYGQLDDMTMMDMLD